MVASIVVASPVRVVALRAVTDTALWSIGCLDLVAVDPVDERGNRVFVFDQPVGRVLEVSDHASGELLDT